MQRILLKFSGELFKSDKNAIDMDKVFGIAQEIKNIKKDKHIGIVFGGGNIFRGRTTAHANINRAAMDYAGMVGTIVNALVLKSVFDALSTPSRIISSLQVPQILGTNSKFDMEKYLDKNEVLIFAAGTGNPYVSTDTAAVIRALEIKADIVLKSTGVDGIYDSNPKQNSNAKLFKKLTYQEFLAIPNAFILDKTAVTMAMENKMPIYVFKWNKGCLKKAVKQNIKGTLIS